MINANATTAGSAPSKTFMDKLLDGVETLGNKVPHPVMMFVYLIVFVIVLSTILQIFGVSVTEQVLEPVPVPVEHNFYPDTTQIQIEATQDGLEWSDTHFKPQLETIPDQRPPDDRGHPLPVHVVRPQLPELRRHRRHVHRDDGRRPGRVRRTDGRVDPQAGRRRAARADRVFDHPGRRPVERRLGRWVSDPDSARRRGVRQSEAQPDRRPGGGFRRRRGDLRGQHHHPADRRDARRDDQRSHRADRRRAPVDRQQLTSSMRSRWSSCASWRR